MSEPPALRGRAVRVLRHRPTADKAVLGSCGTPGGSEKEQDEARRFGERLARLTRQVRTVR